MEMKELMTKTSKDLQKLLQKYREELRVLNFKVAAAQLKDMSLIKKIRRNIAQVMMILRDK